MSLSITSTCTFFHSRTSWTCVHQSVFSKLKEFALTGTSFGWTDVLFVVICYSGTSGMWRLFVPLLLHCDWTAGWKVTVMSAAFYPKLNIFQISASGKNAKRAVQRKVDAQRLVTLLAFLNLLRSHWKQLKKKRRKTFGGTLEMYEKVMQPIAFCGYMFSSVVNSSDMMSDSLLAGQSALIYLKQWLWQTLCQCPWDHGR